VIRPGRRAALLAATAVLVAGGCQPMPSGPAGTPGPSASLGAGPSGDATLQPPTTLGPPGTPTPGPADPVVLDAALLDLLPAAIGDIPVTESIDEAAQALTDPALPQIATALDAAVAVDTATGNLVYALVVKLRPEAFNASTFAQWRDSYDEGACTASGGVVGRAEATIDERTVYITSCAVGLRTYHVWLEEQGILVSASSIGEDRYGEQLMDNLRVED
jgi:hypothetical protein